MHNEDYFSISEKFKQESELKIKFACLCKSYDINEKKLYSRTVEMVRKKVIDNLSSNLLERKDITKIPIDTSYMTKDVIEIIQSNGDLLVKKYLSPFKKIWV